MADFETPSLERDASNSNSVIQQSKDQKGTLSGKESNVDDGKNSDLRKNSSQPTESKLDYNKKSVTKPSPSKKDSDTKKTESKEQFKSNGGEDVRKPFAVDRSHIRRRYSSQDRQRSLSRDRKRSTSRRRSGSRSKIKRSVSRRRSVSGNRKRSTSRRKDSKELRKPSVVDDKKHSSSSSHQEPHMRSTFESKCVDSGIRVIDHRKEPFNTVRRRDRSNSRSKKLTTKKRSTSRERRRSRSRRRSTSRKRSDSRSNRRRSSRSCDRHDSSSKLSKQWESGKPAVLDQRWRSKDVISPRKERTRRRSRSTKTGDHDLRKRIEMLKKDINQQKMELEEQRLAGRNRSEESYHRLLETESVWQQLALEEENQISGRLEHLGEQYDDCDSQWRPPPTYRKQTEYDGSQSPAVPYWSSSEQRGSYLSQSRSKSPLVSHHQFYDVPTSTRHSPARPDSRLYNRKNLVSDHVESEYRRGSASPPPQQYSPSRRLAVNNRTDVGSHSIDNRRSPVPAQSPSANKWQLKRTCSPPSSGVERKQHRSRSPSPVSSDGRRSSSRCGSLDLEWPSSPCQPTSGAGREGNLSPISCRLAKLGLPERQKLRLFTTQRANQLYSARNDVLRPSASDISSTLGSDLLISVERQSLRALAGSLKMNRLAGYDWSQRSVGDFNMRDLLGKGEHYEVFKAVDKKGQSVVVLRTVCADRANDGFRRPALRVIKMLSQLVHPNIVRLLEVIKDKSESAICDGNSGKYFLSFEYCAYDLNSLLHGHNMKFRPEHIACVARQLLEGIAFCHQRGIVHCDVRPCNVLVSAKGEVKLSYFVGAHSAGDAVGDTSLLIPSSLCYRAPELILGAELWSTSADMWSVGCVLGELIRGRPMFAANDDLQLLLTICSVCGTPSLAAWPDVVKLPRYYMLNSRPSSARCLLNDFANDLLEAVSLMDSMLVLNPSLRMQASAALGNRWLIGVGPKEMSSLANCLGALEKSKTMNSENMGFRPIDNFDFLSAIDSGQYGYTYKALDNVSNVMVSLRTAGDSSGISDEAKKLLNVHRQLVNPNIVQILETVRDSSKSASFMYYLCFEYAAHDLGGLLQDSAIEFSRTQQACIFSQILRALTFCHVKNIIHCDIRPCNILITSKGEVKLSGFTSFRMNGDPSCLDQLPSDSLWYRAPELLLGSNKLTPAVDMWSCGCVLGEMLKRKPLFGASVNDVQQLLSISALCGTPVASTWPDVIKLPKLYILKNRPLCARRLVSEFIDEPPAVFEVLDGLLTLCPAKRFMAFTALNCQWLKNIQVESSRATLPLPKSRDCRSVCKQEKTSTVVDDSASHTVEGASSQVSEKEPQTGGKEGLDVVGGSSLSSVTGSMKIDFSSAESVHQALSKLLMAPRTVESLSPQASSTTEKTRQPVAGTKTFMKVIDHAYQPSDGVQGQKINVEQPRRNDSPSATVTGHRYQPSSSIQTQKINNIKTYQRSVVSNEDQDYRTAVQFQETNHGGHPLTSGSSIGTNRIVVASDNAQSSQPVSKPTPNVGPVNAGSEFWDEMKTYADTYEAKMLSTRMYMPEMSECVGAALSRYREELLKDSGKTEESPVVSSEPTRLEVESSNSQYASDFGVQRSSRQEPGLVNFVDDRSQQDPFHRGVTRLGEDHIAIRDACRSLTRVPRETVSTIVAGPSDFGEDTRHVNLKNMLVTVGNDRFRPSDEAPRNEISVDERRPEWKQRLVRPPSLGRSAVLAAPPKVRQELRGAPTHLVVGDNAATPRPNFDTDAFAGTRNVFDQRTVVARAPSASSIGLEDGVEWRTLQSKHR